MPSAVALFSFVKLKVPSHQTTNLKKKKMSLDIVPHRWVIWVYVEKYQIFFKSFSWTSLRPKLISYISHECKWDKYGEASLSNVSQIWHIITLLDEIRVCLESHRHSCDCLQRVLFPRPFIPSRSPEINFTAVIVAIWSDSKLGNIFSAPNVDLQPQTGWVTLVHPW